MAPSHAYLPRPCHALQASAAGNSDAKRVYRREAQLQQLVLVGAKLLTNSSTYLPAARKAVLRSLASSVVPTTAGRRLLGDATVQALGQCAWAGRAEGCSLLVTSPVQPRPNAYMHNISLELTPCARPPPLPLADFTSGALVQQLVQIANTLAAASIPPAELTTLSSAVLEAVANSMAAMNSLIETSDSVEAVQKVGGHGSSWLLVAGLGSSRHAQLQVCIGK